MASEMLSKVKKVLKQSVIISSAIATLLVVGMQKLQLLENMELRAYDQMMQMRGDSGKDSRLLVVEVTEKDLQKWGFPLSGNVLDRLLETLEGYEPRAIGLDILRDIPVEPGHQKLLERLQFSSLIFPVCKHPNSQDSGNSAPEGTEPTQVGFADIVEDTDAVIRRNLISVSVDPSGLCQTSFSLSWQLATKFLDAGGINPKLTDQQEIKLGDVVLNRLQSHHGGYENADAQGYQILFNYRSDSQIAEKVTVTDVLEGRVESNLVKDRIILIGATAPSLKDFFNTPFTSGKATNQGKMSGVEVHAQAVSQILSAVLNKRPLFWFLPGWGEVIWIGVWSVAGSFVAWRINHPLSLGLAVTGSLVVLFSGNFLIFTQAGWFPVISPALSLIFASVGVISYSSYFNKQEQEQISKSLEEQKQLIAQLQTYKSTSPSPQAPGIGLGEELPLDTLLNKRYKITQNLASGGFGTTYLAEDVQRPGNPRCVVKQMRPAQQDPEYLSVMRRLFKTEADILEILGKHPQIPSLLAFSEQNDQFYLMQEFIDGHCMSDELQPELKRSKPQVIKIIKEILEILVFVHSYGVVHRDLKPDNLIRRGTDQKIVLIDFGAVKQLQPQEENYSIIIGTPAYAPPEQLTGQPQLNGDIYSLGIIAIQALTGVKPKFQRDGTTGVVIIQKDDEWLYWWEVWDENALNQDQQLIDVINKMSHLDFTQRYQSSEEVLKILENL